MEELLKELEKAKEYLKDFNRFNHLFSDDDAKRRLAGLNRVIHKIIVEVKISAIKEVSFPHSKAILPSREQGLVRIRPSDKKYNNKTYIGFYIGDIAHGSSVSIADDKISCEFTNYNPAIYVPELNEVIYGFESWWGNIESIDELEEISDKTIADTWYVKAVNYLTDNGKRHGI